MESKNIIKEAAFIKPSERQLAWQEMEFYAFVHFGVNTFTDREWGDGKESPTIFNPTELDADQWVQTIKTSGMTGLILTCKHHDGFCLWPSAFTEHSIKNSPWKNGKGDVVREVSNACERAGIKFGVYLSPWDRHEKTYGNSDVYNQYFKNQLSELLTNYGDIFCVWFDGACGEGSNGKRQIYDWESYYDVIRKLQPSAVISVCGPDVRWCGNEAGSCRKSEWSVVPSSLMDNEKIKEKSQKVDDGKFSRRITSREEDLGSRQIINKAEELVWFPAEVNTSIRPGWFYHASEDNQVRTLEELLNIYYGSVGGNGCFLLNLPPDKRGLIHENDVQRLKEIGDTIKSTFSHNIAETSSVKASEEAEAHEATKVIDGNRETFWCPKEGNETAEIIVKLNKIENFDVIVLKEHISSGQRVESFILEIEKEKGWTPIYEGTVIGYKHICRFEKISAKNIRLKITGSRWCPEISEFAVFKS